MATHDYVIANGTGAAVRSDLNGALAAIVSQNSSASAPATMYAYMLWADTTAGIMKMRNGANSAWISLWELDGTFIASDISLAAGSAAAPSLFFTGDTNTGLFSPGADTVALATAGSNRLHITSAGLVGIGTTSPAKTLHVNGDIRLPTDFTISWSDDACRIFRATNDLRIDVGSSERARIDSSGRLLVGTSTSDAVASALQIAGTGYGGTQLITRYADTGTGDSAQLYLTRTRGSSPSARTLVLNGDEVGYIGFNGTDGSTICSAAAISASVDGTPGANDMPGRLVFSTTADGAASPTERMRIQSGGTVLIGKTSSNLAVPGAELAGNGMLFTVNDAQVAYFNRSTSDGTIIEFRQDNNLEGTISVSGTTVSYNGAHLSRWSQLPSSAEREEILRGTVLSNLDEMCGWSEEENEQLNRMKVSDVEGDKNVSGVFQAWDDDDDIYTDDFYCAMTGDFIIRIAEGVTVERGDLLMSAGDGTAKFQGDGYVQDKTIAKVTSTKVSCTYEDGSYCVPCVLMAC